MEAVRGWVWIVSGIAHFGSCIKKYMNSFNKFQKGFGHANH